MAFVSLCALVLVLAGVASSCEKAEPVVINTWPFTSATAEAWKALVQGSNNRHASLEAVEAVNIQLEIYFDDLKIYGIYGINIGVQHM